MAGGGTLRGPGDSAGSLVEEIRVPKALGLLPTHWQVKPGPGVSTRLLAGKAGSWSLAAGPRDPRAHFRLLCGERFLIPLCMGSRVSQRLCWPPSRQGQGPVGPRIVSGLC